MQPKHSKESGFTLIELLISIVIIGILTAIILNTLSTSRNRGYDGKVKIQFKQLATSIQIYYENNGNYGATTNNCDNMFAATTPVNINKFIVGLQNGAAVCRSTGTAYAVSIPLLNAPVSADNWCIDSNGRSIAIADPLIASDTSCN
ncbi:MAG: type II secretion system protein [Patescibacteria group bacterium]